MPFDDQSTYQVRAEWGVAGLRRLAPADIVVVVDALRFTSTVTSRVAAGESVPLDSAAHEVSINGAVVAEAAGASGASGAGGASGADGASGTAGAGGATVLAGALTNAESVANAILHLQQQRGSRTSVAIIACGERIGRESAEVRFAVEDQLAAGAIIAALSDIGIDHTSPEAAVMGESFRALRRALVHLLLASGSGRQLTERGQRDEVLAAAELNSITAVAVLVDGTFKQLELQP